MDANDLMTLKAFENGGGMSPYEQVKIGYMQSKRPSGVGIAGLVLGTVGTAAAIGAWIFAPVYGNAKANQARYLARQQYDGTLALINANSSSTQRQLDQLTNLFAAERAERINGDTTITQTVTDTVSGQQAASLTAQQAAELSSVQSVQNTLFTNAMLGNLSQNPQRVALYRDATPCACPASNCGCGCNG